MLLPIGYSFHQRENPGAYTAPTAMVRRQDSSWLVLEGAMLCALLLLAGGVALSTRLLP